MKSTALDGPPEVVLNDSTVSDRRHTNHDISKSDIVSWEVRYPSPDPHHQADPYRLECREHFFCHDSRRRSPIHSIRETGNHNIVIPDPSQSVLVAVASRNW